MDVQKSLLYYCMHVLYVSKVDLGHSRPMAQIIARGGAHLSRIETGPCAL